MDENRNLEKKSEEMTKSKEKHHINLGQGIKDIWYSLSTTGRDIVAASGVGGFVLIMWKGISHNYRSDFHIGNHFRWTFGPSKSKDDFDDD